MLLAPDAPAAGAWHEGGFIVTLPPLPRRTRERSRSEDAGQEVRDPVARLIAGATGRGGISPSEAPRPSGCVLALPQAAVRGVSISLHFLDSFRTRPQGCVHESLEGDNAPARGVSRASVTISSVAWSRIGATILTSYRGGAGD